MESISRGLANPEAIPKVGLSTDRQLSMIRFCCRTVSRIVVALAAWCSRTTMYADEISYGAIVSDNQETPELKQPLPEVTRFSTGAIYVRLPLTRKLGARN